MQEKIAAFQETIDRVQVQIDKMQEERRQLKQARDQLRADRRMFKRLINDGLARMNHRVDALSLKLYTPLQLVGDSPLEMLGYAIFENIKNTQAPVIDSWFNRLEREVKDGQHKSLFDAFKTYAYGLLAIPSKYTDDATREELRAFFEMRVFSDVFTHVSVCASEDY